MPVTSRNLDDFLACARGVDVDVLWVMGAAPLAIDADSGGIVRHDRS